MALRRQVPDSHSTYEDPILGVNLRDDEEALTRGEARLMKNCYVDGGVRIRRGSQRLTTASLNGSATRIRGGHKFYYGGASATSKRLVAYSTRVSVVSDSGTETNLTTGMSNDLNTYFTTWSIEDSVYLSNGTDTVRKYDGTTFSTLSGTNIPVARGYIAPILDRLMAITTNGIERTDPRDDSIWSSNSTWATLRPSLVGLFVTLHPFTVKGTDTLYPGILAFQQNAYYLITGTNFGSDVTAGTASTGEDSAIRLLDANVGTSSPQSVVTVPGIGIFWFTSDLNVFWLPEGSLSGRYVGDRIFSTGTTAGIEDTNEAALAGVWMRYFDRKLILGIPTGTNTYATTQFWMDMRSLVEHPDRGPVWYGPMTGQTVGVAWTELQNGDNAIYGGEGNASTGAFVYQLYVNGRYTDAVGTTDTSVGMEYQTYFKAFGAGSREKYVREIHLDLNGYSGDATVDLYDLDGKIASDLMVQAV